MHAVSCNQCTLLLLPISMCDATPLLVFYKRKLKYPRQLKTPYRHRISAPLPLPTLFLRAYFDMRHSLTQKYPPAQPSNGAPLRQRTPRAQRGDSGRRAAVVSVGRGSTTQAFSDIPAGGTKNKIPIATTTPQTHETPLPGLCALCTADGHTPPNNGPHRPRYFSRVRFFARRPVNTRGAAFADVDANSFF